MIWAVVVGLVIEVFWGRTIYHITHAMGKDVIYERAHKILQRRIGSAYKMLDPIQANWGQLKKRIANTQLMLPDEVLASWTPQERFYVAMACYGAYLEHDELLSFLPGGGWKALLAALAGFGFLEWMSDAAHEFERINDCDGFVDSITAGLVAYRTNGEILGTLVSRSEDGWAAARKALGAEGIAALSLGHLTLRDIGLAMIPHYDTGHVVEPAPGGYALPTSEPVAAHEIVQAP